MARIPAVSPDQAGPLIRLAYRYAKRSWGEVLEPLAVTAHHPKLFVTNLVHQIAARKAASVLPQSVANLAAYRVVCTVGCTWCVDFGALMARLSGTTVAQLEEIDDYATSRAYTDDERAAISYADAMTATPPKVTDEQVADLEHRFGRAGVVELTYLIVLENADGRMNAALGITAQGFGSDACRVPWSGGAAAPAS